MSPYRRPQISGFYVYQYLRTVDSKNGKAGSPYYVGKGHGKRAFCKNSIEIRLPRDKSGIVIMAAGLTEEQAFCMEIDLIRIHGRIDLGTGCLRNKTNGGEGTTGAIRTAEMRAKVSAVHKGLKHSDAAKAKMSLSRTGTKRSDETRARMSAAGKGKHNGPMSEAAKAKISAANIGKPKPLGFKEKIAAANRRRKLSEESKAKISRSLTGKKRSEESKAKQSASGKGSVPHNKGKVASKETRAKMSATHKRRWDKRHESDEKADTFGEQNIRAA